MPLPLVDRLKNEYATLGKSVLRKEGFMRAVALMLNVELECHNAKEKNNVFHYITGFDPMYLNFFKEY